MHLEYFCQFWPTWRNTQDNGLQFTSKDFELFCVNNGIKNTCTLLYHPASNWAAEQVIQVIKMAMVKMGKDPPLKHRLTKFLQSYNTTTVMRPDDLFLHRCVRTWLTLVQTNLVATVEKTSDSSKEGPWQHKSLSSVLRRSISVGQKSVRKTEATGMYSEAEGSSELLSQSWFKVCHVEWAR